MQTTPAYGVVSGPGTAFSGLTLSPEIGTDESTLRRASLTSRKTGYRVNSGSFTIAETPATSPVLLGRNGKRFLVRWRPQGVGAGRAVITFEAIATISRAMNGRGRRDFSVDLMIDGCCHAGDSVMTINPKWLAELVAENEYGETERWGFPFQAPHDARDAAFVKAQAATRVTSDKVELILEAPQTESWPGDAKRRRKLRALTICHSSCVLRCWADPPHVSRL